jgi:TPR repeat protein
MRQVVLLLACLVLGACATNIVAEKASRFDEGVAAYDAGDFAAAYRIWDELARQDDLAAMRNVAQLLRQGRGVEKDSKRAFRLYTEAAEKGLVTAMANLGDMYLAGEGTERNPQAAAAWYARAASAGLSLAQWKLAEMYENGTGVPVDKDRAQALLERAARNGYVPAQERLAARGITPAAADTETAEPKTAPAPPAAASAASAPPASPGDPLSPEIISKMAADDLTIVHAGLAAYAAADRPRALQLWQTAAARGVAEAQFRAGLMFARGEGTPRDAIEAYRWLRLASSQGHPPAIEELARLSATLAPAERAIGESLVRQPAGSTKKPE